MLSKRAKCPLNYCTLVGSSIRGCRESIPEFSKRLLLAAVRWIEAPASSRCTLKAPVEVLCLIKLLGNRRFGQKVGIEMKAIMLRGCANRRVANVSIDAEAAV
jgi:hypothetical protein